MHRRLLALLIISCLGLATACGESPTAPPAAEADLRWVGDSCVDRRDCQDELICSDGLCDFAAITPEGSACKMTGECAEALFCDTSPQLNSDGNPRTPSASGVCRSAGDGQSGGVCGSSADCQKGLVCVAQGFSGICSEAGSTAIGDSCEEVTDCFAGLSCSASAEIEGKACASGTAGTPQFFPGVECETEDSGEFRSYFEVPTGDDSDFFRLPYPNDIRTSNGRLDLSGFPTPGADLLGFDIVERYIDAIEEGQRGFGLKPVTFFRFSERIDFNTLDARGDFPTLRFLDITPDSPNYNRQPSLSWSYNSAAQRYICQNWISVTNGWGRPLQANTTYAVILMGDIRSDEGEPMVRDEDFDAMMKPAQPAGLGDAWDAYQPLRDWAADQAEQEGFDPDQILTANVFTTGDPRSQVADLRAPARSEAPQLNDLVLCDDETTSVCDDGLDGEEHTRGCFGANDDFAELQASLSLPVFQEGNAPYLESGGAVSTSLVRQEEVCTSITIPKIEMPETGWPLLITSHGTGGDYRSHLGQITPLVNELTFDGASTGMVVLGWDQVLHATRQGEAQSNPEPLVYNYANPAGARGNFLQSAADLFAIVAWAETFELSAEDSPTGKAIRFDPNQIHVMGHSQGGTSTALALAYEPTIKAALLSGAGSGLSYALLEKKSPNDALLGLQFALQDPTVSSPNHPVMSLIQGYFDSVDPHSHAAYIVEEELPGLTSPHHVFQTYGLGDTYTPPRTMELLARGIGADHVGPFMEQFSGVDAVDSPVSGNRDIDGTSYTSAIKQYEPGDYDGHFVTFRHPDAQQDLQRYFGSTILAPEGVPTVGD